MLAVRIVYAVESGCYWELASSMSQSLSVYFSGVDRLSGWDLVQSMVTPCGRRALRWCSTA
jgi:hypothetical protein